MCNGRVGVAYCAMWRVVCNLLDYCGSQSELVEPVRPVGQVGQVGLVEPAGAVDLDPEARRRKVAMLKVCLASGDLCLFDRHDDAGSSRPRS